jgi:molybdopterin-guanine dinucleotide biosynthesis protein A
MTFTAVLFAGGLSRRMKTDKATLSFAGESLWAKQLKRLRELQPEFLWISARERPVWCPQEVEVVLDSPPSRGPLSGLAAVLPRLRTTHLLALAIDLPQMTTGQLRKLVAMAQPGRGVIPMNGEHFEPLCAIYPALASAIIADALAGRDASLQSVSQTLVTLNLARAYTLADDEKPRFLNMNSPGDWRAIQSPA